jgi:hypothetical protein
MPRTVDALPLGTAKVAVLNTRGAARGRSAMGDVGYRRVGPSDLSGTATPRARSPNSRLTIVGALATAYSAPMADERQVLGTTPPRVRQEPGGKTLTRKQTLAMSAIYIDLCFIEHSMPSYGCSFLSRDRTRGRLTPVMSSEEPAQALMRAREKEFAIAVVDDEACHKPEKCREMLLVGLPSYGEDAQRACGRIPKDMRVIHPTGAAGRRGTSRRR